MADWNRFYAGYWIGNHQRLEGLGSGKSQISGGNQLRYDFSVRWKDFADMEPFYIAPDGETGYW
jgi:hypothetical protein